MLLRALFAKVFSDFEIIIIDDGSTDNTVSILEEFQARDNRIRFIKQSNNGVSSARNRAINEPGKHRYVAFLDSDDVWHSWHLEKSIAVLEHELSVALVFGRRELIDSSGSWPSIKNLEHSDKYLDQLLLFSSPTSLEQVYIIESNKCYLELFRSKFSPWTSSVVVRRDAILRSNWFDTSLEVLEDVEFYLYVASLASFALIDSYMGYYRRHSDNLTASSDLSSPITLRRQRSVERFFKIKLGMCQNAEDRKIVSKEIAETTYIIGQCCGEQLDFASAKEAYLESLHYQLSLKSLKGYVISSLPASVRFFLKKILTATAAI